MCWVVEYFDGITWEDRNILHQILNGLLKGLKDPAIPVQNAAACSFRTLVTSEGAQDLLKPVLFDILKEYFRIINEAESPDSVISALQAIIMQFGSDLIPMAAAMTEQLVNVFANFSNDNNEDLDDDEAAFTASNTLDTISSLIEACQDSPETLLQIEKLMLPTISRVMSGEGACFEYLDCILEMMSFFTYSSSKITPEMFEFCGPLLKAMSEWACDYFNDLMMPLMNFILKEPQQFISSSYCGVNHVDVLLTTISKTLQERDEYENDAKASAILLTSFLLCTKGLISSCLPSLLQVSNAYIHTTTFTTLHYTS